MFPAALAIVLDVFPIRERGRALAIFFGLAGAFTSIGPIAGGYLTEWTWRAIFWINIPVAIGALILIAIAKPDDEKHPAPLDYRGAVMVSAGMGLAVLGLQQSSVWGWGSVATWACIVAGVALLAAFVLYELRVANPLLRVRIFENRAFAVDNAILFLLMIPFVPLFFFASMYAQISLGESASETGLYLLIFFAGFFVATQRGGRVLDRRGARADGRPRLRHRRRRLRALGALECPNSRSARSGRSWSWPGSASASSSARPTPTRSTGSCAAATARRPGSPRRCATSAPASASPCSARS